MKKFKEILIDEIEKSDIDLEYPFYENDKDDERNEIDFIENVWAESPSINIDETIEVLENLKRKGASRVYLYAHGDHQGYIFTGIKFEEDV